MVIFKKKAVKYKQSSLSINISQKFKQRRSTGQAGSLTNNLLPQNKKYTNISSCVTNNGFSSPMFKVEGGVRQGNPLSPYLFIIGLELLLIKTTLALKALTQTTRRFNSLPLICRQFDNISTGQRFLRTPVQYCTAPQMIPRPEMILKLDRR